ncbi:MAG: RloB family protein [Synergistaceae bacterium]|nr:RloB family protein [Synergistaceae bacterium]
MRRMTRFTRKIGSRPYRRIILIASEGRVTEPVYFQAVQSMAENVDIRCVTSSGRSAPPYILKKIKKALNELTTFSCKDSAWVVADKDRWEKEQLDTLYEWAEKAPNYGVAVSNPAFECWLLMHFEEKSPDSLAKCTERLRRYIPNYDKKFSSALITMEAIRAAHQRGKGRDNPPCERYPEIPGRSTVYRLIEDIFGWNQPY